MTFVAEMRERTKGHLPLHEWGPVCAGCGGDEFRIDGYCSVECRDYHCDDAELFNAVLALIEATGALGGVITWLVENHPAAIRAMPTHLFERIGAAGEALDAFGEPA